jgi:hypothetical protein
MIKNSVTRKKRNDRLRDMNKLLTVQVKTEKF